MSVCQRNRQRWLWSYVLRAEREKLSLCVGRLLQASATLRDGGGSALGSRLPKSSCQAGTRKAEGSAALPSRVQERCPRAPSPEPCKGRRPKNRHSKKGETFSVLVSWPACAGAFLVPGRWFSGPAPCLFWFRLVFLSTGRGRHIPAPSGRDVGSSSGAPTQEPVQGADPRTGFYRYPSTYDFVVYLVALVYLVVLALLFPFLFATLFFACSCLAGSICLCPLSSPSMPHVFIAQMCQLAGFTSFLSGALCLVRFWMRDGRVTHSAHLRSLHSVSRHPSFGWP